MTRYYLDPNISWKLFKILNDKFDKSDIKPQHGDRILWRLLRERRITIYIDDKCPKDPIIISLKDIPSGATMLGDPKN